MKSGIYGIHNVANGKWYIGQTTNLRVRKLCHFSELRHGKHHNKHLQSAFKKYGEHNFEFRVLEKTPEDMLDVRERVWVVYYKSRNRKHGYNSESGGNKNKRISTETRRKMSKARKGWKPSEETRLKMSQAKSNISDETRQKMSSAHKGVPLSEKHKRSMRKPWSRARREAQLKKQGEKK